MREEMLIGVDIGGTKCSVCAGDDSGEVQARIVFPTLESQGPGPAVERLLSATEQVLRETGVRPSAIGITCGSPLDPEAGLIQAPPNLPSWKDVEILRAFRERFASPIRLENDANAAALAEYWFGAGEGSRSLVFLTFGTGMGAGLVLDGRLYRGANGYAGEIGHFRLSKRGPIGYNKAGSFEGFCSGPGIEQLADYMRSQHSGSTTLPDRCSAKEIGEAALRGDELARMVLHASGKFLGRGLSYVLDLLNPEIVVIGGIYKRCEDFLRPAMLEELELELEALSQTRQVAQIKPTAFGDDIGDLGGLALAVSLTRERESR